jgi:hypothetical protein
MASTTHEALSPSESTPSGTPANAATPANVETPINADNSVNPPDPIAIDNFGDVGKLE